MTTSPATRNHYDSNVGHMSVWVILGKEEADGRIVVIRKPSRCGHIVRCFFHIFGSPMVEGIAKGGGYDMQSAAIIDAIGNALQHMPDDSRKLWESIAKDMESRSLDNATYKRGIVARAV